jgi:SAM-dependent methyltransferase
MKRGKRSGALALPNQPEIARHYDSGYEADRLGLGAGKIERERSRELIKRFLPPPPATILDIGGGPGAYACWLARCGYCVHLIDIVKLHVDLALKASAAQPDAPLAGAAVGDARSLNWPDASVDGVVLFGPMYHLTDRRGRLRALREAGRVMRKGGVLLAAGISRYASVLDGLRSGFLVDPVFAEIVERDLKDGQHRNPTGRPEYFTDTFFHHPDELEAEVIEAGFQSAGVYGVEGPCWLLHDFDEWWNDHERQARLLHIAGVLEREPSLMGLSAHLIAVGRKQHALVGLGLRSRHLRR